MRGERDLPEGHPSASDYVADSPEAKEYAKTVQDTSSRRDWPVGHPGAADNPDRVEPVHPLESSRDFSRPHTVEGMTEGDGRTAETK
jgi:hypothetical protein